jgi:hypothetical protein
LSNLPWIASLVLDSCSLVELARGDLQTLRLGSLANDGDAQVQRRIAAVLPDPERFPSLFTELACAAWHLSKGHGVTAYEDLAFPDFQRSIPNWDLPVLVDCKRVRKETRDCGFGKVIAKTNAQIKTPNIECFGLAAIDVSEQIEPPKAFSDAVPDRVRATEKLVETALSSGNRSVGGVLLIWDDAVVMGTPPQAPSTLVAYRRRSRLVRHQNPLRPLPSSVDDLTVGSTAAYRVVWAPRA